MRLLSGHSLPRNASNVTCNHHDVNILIPGKTPDPCLGLGSGRGGEGIEMMFPHLKEEREGKRKGKERERKEGNLGRDEKGRGQGDLAPRS